ncbi:MAG: alpha-amylase family glycosyl hydrolase, partial [Oscillospiraceae bacterium]|nr:alpha-amylase family glycosyl hydrolase [Oscillospiraceae bacterium]
ILDGVFSHTGSNSVYFDAENVFGNGAVSCPDSPYREWFYFQHYPDTYTSWWGIKTLPCVNEMNESYREYIYGGQDSVVAHWLRAGADGFRLDVADELPDEFIAGLRSRLKEIKSDALLIGEVWEDASNKISYGQRRRYFSHGELDSVMNYPFRNAILDFVVGNDSGENLSKTVLTICENYPRQVVNVLMNSLSTHDTPRALSLLGASRVPESKEERALFRLSEEQRALAEARLKCAAFLQFTLPGMPCVYYGDEIGTEGLEDPFCRTFFDWEREKKSSLRAFFERLSRFRNKNEALLFGETEIECAGSGVVCLSRRGKKDGITSYVNCSQQSFEINSAQKPAFSENISIKDGKIIIEPYGFAAFKIRR